jgi:hypothetical protein
MLSKKEGISGRPLDIWIQPQPEWREEDYKHIRAKPGVYTVKLIVNSKEYSQKAPVLKDQWYEQRY